MEREVGLNASQLASLDALITVAQQNGRSSEDRLAKTEEHCQAVADIHQAMWDARHGGLELTDADKETFARIRELVSTLELTPTLGQLIELRAEAVRNLNRG